ncbi:MAG: PspC domain-containing protein [Patescibacteria group bacterium]|jgi:phage shock protein C
MQEETKKLTRSKKDRILFGVCGGLAEYFHIDATIVRIIFIVAIFLHGIGLLAYFALVLLVPEAESSEEVKQAVQTPLPVIAQPSAIEKSSWFENNRTTLAVLIIIIGFYCLFAPMLHFADYLKFFWPSLIILGGLFLIIKNR